MNPSSIMTLAVVAAIVAASWTVTTCEPVRYLDCGSKVGKVHEVRVDSCPKSPCILKKGKNYTITVTFTSEVNSTKCEAKVYGVVDHIPLPFPIPITDGCKSGINCPIKAGQTYSYVSTLPVKRSYPDVSYSFFLFFFKRLFIYLFIYFFLAGPLPGIYHYSIFPRPMMKLSLIFLSIVKYCC
uniref:NPC intracellular cholesterol transporter 2 n=1 Tax=Eptatretus burgeri TaxID=7764 RepID=A0A8C4N697_EPTBU